MDLTKHRALTGCQNAPPCILVAGNPGTPSRQLRCQLQRAKQLAQPSHNKAAWTQCGVPVYWLPGRTEYHAMMQQQIKEALI